MRRLACIFDIRICYNTQIRLSRLSIQTNTYYLKIVSLIYFMVSEIDTLTKFRWPICYTFIINCTSFEKLHGFSINMH